MFALSTRRSIRLLRFCLACTLRSFPTALLGSLEIALKRTRPRQRFCYVVGRYSMTEQDPCQEENYMSLLTNTITRGLQD
jgi:hypothetical protein